MAKMKQEAVAEVPAVPVQKHQKPSALVDTRVIYCGDNLEQLSKLPDKCVDLIYIDPPFNSLLERIVNASSNKNDIILDAFCGCGTALVAAEQLNRQWIGIDVSPTACRVMAKRLRDVCHIREDEKLWHTGRGFVVRDLPWTIAKLQKIPPFEFENWAVIALGGVPNVVQVGDHGIDGRVYPVGTKPSDQNSMFAGDWFPIQVKQSEKTGRPEIQQFMGVMTNEDRQRGFYVSFDYSQEAHDEVSKFFKNTGRIIKLITVQEILDEQHVQKM